MRVVVTNVRAEMEAVLADVEIAAASVPRDLILAAPKLRWYQQWAAGADWLQAHPEAVGRDFVLTSTSGIHAVPISEHVLAMMLMFARDMPRSMRAQLRHEWPKGEGKASTFELPGKTLLVVGLGAIGRRTGQLASAFGMKVIGVRRNPGQQVEGVESIVGPGQLHAVLPLADMVLLALPLTEETRHMFGAAELRLMKPTAYLFNVGRGASVDEAALIEALRQRRIAGAGLDVTETEPLPADSPLWEMENVILTPHYSGGMASYNEKALEIFTDNLRRYQAGEPLRNVVDKRLGY